MFYDWMINRYLEKRSPRGDLADDMYRDDDFPRLDDRTALLLYLEGLHACPEAISVFKRAYRDYAKKTGLPDRRSFCSRRAREEDEKRAWNVLLELRKKEAGI